MCVATVMNNSLNSLFILKVHCFNIFHHCNYKTRGKNHYVGMLVGSFKKLKKYKFLLLCASLPLALPTQSDNT